MNDIDHWAYQAGARAGREGRRAERGLMQFGLAFAADPATETNTRLWLRGFDAHCAPLPLAQAQ